MTRVLDVKGLTGGYGSVQILYGIDMHINEGEFVTIIGPNGCGKSTFIKAIFGIADYYEGQVSYRERRISGMRTDQLVNLGIAYVPQVNNVFPSLSVEENLQMGGNSLSGNILSQRIERALDMFPDLRSREHDLAASLSGGERQMLAISRALISDPNFWNVDLAWTTEFPICSVFLEVFLKIICVLENNLLAHQHTHELYGISDL